MQVVLLILVKDLFTAKSRSYFFAATAEFDCSAMPINDNVQIDDGDRPDIGNSRSAFISEESYRGEFTEVFAEWSTKDFNLVDYCSVAATSGRTGLCKMPKSSTKNKLAQSKSSKAFKKSKSAKSSKAPKRSKSARSSKAVRRKLRAA